LHSEQRYDSESTETAFQFQRRDERRLSQVASSRAPVRSEDKAAYATRSMAVFRTGERVHRLFEFQRFEANEITWLFLQNWRFNLDVSKRVEVAAKECVKGASLLQNQKRLLVGDHVQVAFVVANVCTITTRFSVHLTVVKQFSWQLVHAWREQRDFIADD
jgi:hypothetical protein